MIHLLQFSLLFAICIGSATASSALPTHCKPDEYSITNAWMGPTKATGGGWKSAEQGTLLSLCADKPIEPFSRLTYRYGAPGFVEFEAVATKAQKFFVFSRSTSPHTGEDIIFFSRGNYTYYVAVAGGQGHGVSLRVYSGKKLIFDRFSGNYENEDYSVGPAEVDFTGSRSRILTRKAPAHKF
ncbi:MAG: hypothetical protein EON50_00120 [Acidovorax sp.]|nr:MAG: hypothetical protein EON50_00120 [Acidovorax sp.]